MRVKDVIITIYRFLFCRLWAYKLNKLLFDMSLRGLGILNHENDKISGEDSFLVALSKYSHGFTALDVGANIGKYSNTLKGLCPDSKIYAFEPHPKTFRLLWKESQRNKYVALNLGCSDVKGKVKLYDYENQDGSSHASFYQDVIEEIHSSNSISTNVDVITIDCFIEEYKIPKVMLLKVDTEGNELKVLQGAKKSIEQKIIDIIHFEFNEMNTSSRVFFKDFYDLLPNYKFYRMLPCGLVCLGSYRPLRWEIFAYQNVVAVRQDCIDELKSFMYLKSE